MGCHEEHNQESSDKVNNDSKKIRANILRKRLCDISDLDILILNSIERQQNVDNQKSSQ